MADSDVCKCKNLLCEMYTSKHDIILIVSSEGCSTIVMWVLCRWFGLAALNYSVKVQRLILLHASLISLINFNGGFDSCLC